jgi:hypothetical protein
VQIGGGKLHASAQAVIEGAIDNTAEPIAHRQSDAGQELQRELHEARRACRGPVAGGH